MLETDILDFKIDPVTGDLVITTDLQLSSGLSGVVQAVRTRMLTFKGEIFYDLEEGIPYLAREGIPQEDALLGMKPFNEVKARKELRDCILATPGIVELLSLQLILNKSTRGLSVTWQARTEFGDTPVDKLSIGG